MNKETKIAIVGLCIAVTIALANLALLTRVEKLYTNMPERMFEDSRLTSCRGIKFFYSNESFIADFSMLTEFYKKVGGRYDADVIQEPLGLFDLDGPYDCEDYAHAVRCLAELYNIPTTFYYLSYSNVPIKQDNETVFDTSGHIGACFDYNNTMICDYDILRLPWKF